MKDKIFNIVVFIFIAGALLFLAFSYFNLHNDGIFISEVFEFLGNIWNFIGNHTVSFIGLIICVIVIVVLLRARKFVISQEINYRRILHEREVEIAKKNRDLQDLQFFNDQKSKSLDEMTAHYNAAQDEINKRKPLNEGNVKKDGINPPPLEERPSQPPPGQQLNKISKSA